MTVDLTPEEVAALRAVVLYTHAMSGAGYFDLRIREVAFASVRMASLAVRKIQEAPDSPPPPPEPE